MLQEALHPNRKWVLSSSTEEYFKGYNETEGPETASLS